ncbi:MAG: NAD(P)/FAD-dependent oxidoreductase [Clostridiales bacterium]|nr:NAD(P)/FAD-dependent oxidoreductase [Clostridiales bacterium]
MNYDIIIVGAGASGLMAAITAARNGRSVLIIEQKEKAGKKILATGNGKCNFTNMYQSPDCYRSDDSTFVSTVLSSFDTKSTLDFFKELGIYPKERNGYIYPNSEQAASMVSVLLMECERLKVKIAYNEKVVNISQPDFTLTTLNKDYKESTYRVARLILATGGMATPKLGSDGSGYKLAKLLGHKVNKPLPALVSLKSPDKFCKTISGVRIQAKVRAYTERTLLSQEEGEIIFTDYGISGIPIMQLSRFVAKALDSHKKVHLVLDFLPEKSIGEVKNILKYRCKSSWKTIEQMMVGMFNHKLNYVMIKKAGLDPQYPCNYIKDGKLKDLAEEIKNFKININNTNTFDFAQVTTGGVLTSEINPLSMESKVKNNLFLTGELIDVDGTCGGYNLQWAWSTGYIAGNKAFV